MRFTPALLTLLALSSTAMAAQTVEGDILRISYGDGGTWCETDTAEAGFQTKFPEDDGLWRDWVYPGSPWQHLTLAWEADDTSYLYEGNTDYGYWDWEASAEEDRSDDDTAESYYEWTLDDLVFTKTERWSKDSSQLLVLVTIENTGSSDVGNLRYHWQVDPDQDQFYEAFSADSGSIDTGGDTGFFDGATYDTLLDSVDTDDDEMMDYIEAVGPESGYTMVLGACDDAEQEVGGNYWDTDPDIEMIDFEGEELDETMHVRQTLESLAAGESATFGFVIAAAVDSATAVADYEAGRLACPNCDGDGDGVANDTCGEDDCDDNDASIYPGAEDTWYDGIDSDCAGNDDFDADGDTFVSSDYEGDDCNDADPSIYPGAEDTWYDGIDSDCGGENDYDADGDGHESMDHGGDDYDDTDPEVWEDPSADTDTDTDADTDTDGTDGSTDTDGGSDTDTDADTDTDGGSDGGASDTDTDGGDDGDDGDEKTGCLSSTTGTGAPGPFGAGMALLGLGALFLRRRR